jgi:hypothetical protein
MTSAFIRVLVLVLLCWAVPAAAQHRSNFPQPPQPAERPTVSADPKPAPVQRIDPSQLQREARELADLAQTVPLDVEKVNQGLLPKDASEKLKRIEKLAKRLRSALTP